jgi:signal peptidase II
MSKKMMRRKRNFLLIAIVGIIFDQLTKYIVVQNFSAVGNTLPLWQNVFHLTYVINTGAAFSFFRGQVDILRWISLIVLFWLFLYGILPN